MARTATVTGSVLVIPSNSDNKDIGAVFTQNKKARASCRLAYVKYEELCLKDYGSMSET